MIYIGIDPGVSGGLFHHQILHRIAVKLQHAEINKSSYATVQASMGQKVSPTVFAEDKIIGAVVLWVAVNVMNNLVIRQIPSDLALHNNAMFGDVILSSAGVAGFVDKNMASIRPTLELAATTPIAITICRIDFGSAFVRFANCFAMLSTVFSIIAPAAKNSFATHRASELQKVEPSHLAAKQSPTEIVSVFMWIVSIPIPFFSEIGRVRIRFHGHLLTPLSGVNI